MKLGIVQNKPEFGQVDENLYRVRELIKGIQVDILVLPELFSTGYVFKDKMELLNYAELSGDGKTQFFLKQLSRDLDAAVIGGFPELDCDNVYNSAMIAMPDSRWDIYRKIHLFNTEKSYFTPGNKPFFVTEFRGAKIGTMICFDWIFPESYRTLALKGADLICHCTNLVLPYCQQASYAHAVSNRVFIALANRIGREKRAGVDVEFTGQSVIYSPWGEQIAQAESSSECCLTVEIDISRAREKNVTEKNHVFNDRRREFYEI